MTQCFRKWKWRAASKTNVINLRKRKSLRKKKRKGFHGRRKNNSAINNSKPPKSDLASASSTSATTTTSTNVTTDYNRTPSASTVNNTRTNDEVELPDVIDNNKSIMEKQQGCELLDDTNLLYPLKTSTRK